MSPSEAGKAVPLDEKAECLGDAGIVAGEAHGVSKLAARGTSLEAFDWAPPALVTSRKWPSTFWEVRSSFLRMTQAEVFFFLRHVLYSRYQRCFSLFFLSTRRWL